MSDIAELQRQTLERLAAEATILGNPISADELERGLFSTGVVPDGKLAQLLAAQGAAARAFGPATGNRQQRRARAARGRRQRQ